jgi:transcriptional regulator with XRE-family HTH domain
VHANRLPAGLSERNDELAAFLQRRREAIDPREVGIAPTTRRRLKGLRREEVATLAGIGVAWYARIERGLAHNPSAATLTAIASALRLSKAETEHLFRLSGTPLSTDRVGEPGIPDPLSAYVQSVTGAAATMYDAYYTPLRWNTVADAIFDYSSVTDALHRNVIVRGLRTPIYENLFHAEFLAVASLVIGTFRREFVSHQPSPLALQVYDFAKDFELFRECWDAYKVSDEPAPTTRFTRVHSGVGVLTCDAIELNLQRMPNLRIRILMPADALTRHKFATLDTQGRPSSIDTPID